MKKKWLDSYQKGVPHYIDINSSKRSIADDIDETFKKYGEMIAYKNFGTSITYNDIDIYSRKFATYLQNVLCLTKGSRIGIMTPNTFHYPIALFAAIRSGLIVVNINPLYTENELTHQINDSGLETIIVLENFAHTVQASMKKSCLTNVIVSRIGDFHGFIKGSIMNFVNKYIKKQIKDYSIVNKLDFVNIIKITNSNDYSRVETCGDDIAFLQYTGGTTGVSKGAMLTHSNILSNMSQAQSWILGCKNVQEKIVTALPLYHVFALMANLFVFFRLGACNILITNPRDIPAFIKQIKNEKFTIITGVNTLFRALLLDKNISSVDFSNLKISLGGGMQVEEVVSRKWQEITGNPINQAYGLTESSPAISINPINDDFNNTVGLPLPSTELSVRDDDGNELDFNQEGELWVKGPQVMLGYWNNKKETNKVMNNNWLCTGDIVKVNDDGYIEILDRKKDVVIVSGFNVYPNEIENVISNHPDVFEVGVTGKKVKEKGALSGDKYEIIAFVVKRNPTVTEDELFTYCRKMLTRYKIPKKIEFVNSLPKTNVGKILRRSL